MREFLILLILVIPGLSSAGNLYCDKVESKGEGHWPISEEEFTKERYNKALEFLAEAPENFKLGMDYVSVETELVYVKGYLLKSAINKDDPESIRWFCEFIKNEAHVRH